MLINAEHFFICTKTPIAFEILIFVIIKVQLQIFLLFSYADHASVPPIASVIAFIAASYSPFAAKVFALLTAVESF